MKSDNNLIPILFESSHGMLAIWEDGTICKQESDLSDWLLTVKKVDIEELDNYHRLNGLPRVEGGDVLDFGYWDIDGTYHRPSKRWRKDIYHSQDLSDKKAKKVIKKSFKWIKKHRS